VLVKFSAAPGVVIDDLQVTIGLDAADAGVAHPLPFDGGRSDGSFLIPIASGAATLVRVALQGHDASGTMLGGAGAIESQPGREVELDVTVGATPYPRLAAFSIGGAMDYDKLSFRQAAAKYPLVVLSYYSGWQSSRSMTMAEVMQDVKSRSTVGTQLFIYVSDDQWYATSTSTPSDEVWQALNDNGWWLYQSGTSGPIVASTYPGHDLCNTSTFSRSVNGQNWMQWKAAYDHKITVAGDANNAANPYLDGLILASVGLQPRADGDWNRDGTTDSASDPTIQSAFRAGGKAWFDAIRALWPSGIPLAQLSGWDAPNAEIGVLAGVPQGGYLDAFIGQSYSPDTWGGFAAMMTGYAAAMDAMSDPKLGIFAVDKWVAGDYPTMRYGLAACLMDDGYFFINDGNYDLDHELWFDEFSADLGQPLEARRTAAWSQGVWKREFDHGIALLNPKGNGAQTVALSGTFRKLQGTQDPSVNDGSTVTRVTLGDRDGLILLR
jgi:hypothetical protein